jgi:hypothetical protein
VPSKSRANSARRFKFTFIKNLPASKAHSKARYGYWPAVAVALRRNYGLWTAVGRAGFDNGVAWTFAGKLRKTEGLRCEVATRNGKVWMRAVRKPTRARARKAVKKAAAK